MRYFTPQRFARLQHVDGESFAGAFGDWERALQEYREELSRLEPRLSEDLRRLASADCLHDAALLGCWRDKDRLSLLLKPTLPSEPLVLLGYRLVGSPWVDRSALSAEHQTPQANWLYDEVSVETDGTFGHAILLSNGWEVRLRFSSVEYGRPEAGLPITPAP